MNKPIFFNMNVAFEKQIYLPRQNCDRTSLQANFQHPVAQYVRNWAVCKYVLKSPELGQI